MNGLKVEEDIKIKADPDSSSPAALLDDDEYEDTGELQFPKEIPTGWLTRIPADLWKSLEKLNDDDEILIGEIKVWNQPDSEAKIRLTLNKNREEFAMTPKEYDLHINNREQRNTFVFSEKDLPGFKPQFMGRNRYNRSQPQDPLKKVDGKVEKQRRGGRTIPKHTAFAAVPQYEVLCSPRETEEWRRLEAQKSLKRAVGGPPMFIKEGIQLGGVANTGGFYNDSQSFIRIGDGKKHRPQENKAARISEGELLDLLAGLFKEYKFWPLKRLKERTRQPEAFLREQLNKIAVLVKTGMAANTWTLNANVAATLNMSDEDLADYNPDEPDIKEEEIAPPASGADIDSVDDDDDDDMEMEDVV